MPIFNKLDDCQDTHFWNSAISFLKLRKREQELLQPQKKRKGSTIYEVWTSCMNMLLQLAWICLCFCPGNVSFGRPRDHMEQQIYFQNWWKMVESIWPIWTLGSSTNWLGPGLLLQDQIKLQKLPQLACYFVVNTLEWVSRSVKYTSGSVFETTNTQFCYSLN